VRRDTNTRDPHARDTDAEDMNAGGSYVQDMSIPGEGDKDVSVRGWSELSAHPAAARGRRMRGAVLDVLLFAAALGTLDVFSDWVPRWVWAAPVLALPIALCLAADAYRGLGHRLGERHLLTRSGSILRRTVALDRGGIVGWTIKQSLFQRRLDLLTVSATTAAGAGHYDVLDVGTGEGLDLAAQAVPGLLEPFLRTDADDWLRGRPS
jgi:putative membrane protein